MSISKISSSLSRYEKVIPVLLFLLFAVITIPGISNIWNPDELVHRVDHALQGAWKFDETNFDYPSLPKYVMYGVGKVVYRLGFSSVEFYQAARLLSVLLGAAVVALLYRMTRLLGGNIFAALLAAFLTISNSEIAVNARFAHNDLYLTFFITLAVYFLIKYKNAGAKLWLYGAFFSVGLAASSKYNGAGFVIVPVLVLLFTPGNRTKGGKLEAVETLFIGLVLSFLGFAAGTPKALLWMSFYFKRMTPALLHHASYGQTPDSVRGILGQWGTLKTLLGAPVYYLFVSAFLYFFVKIILWQLKKIRDERGRLPFVSIVILAVVVFDLPIMVSYNYQPRFFIPLIPLLSALSALFVGELLALIEGSKYAKARILLSAGAVLIVIFGLLRVASVSLLIQNDPRIAAGEFIETLPPGTSLEYTLYPPVIPENHFEREHTYPIFFVKFLGQSVPPVQRGKPYRAFNEGEAGLEDRETDYFVIDSFTYARFANDYICETNPVECDFFERLLAGETGYRLIGDFKYSLPKFLPQLSISFVNPEIRVYERVEK